MAKKIKENKIEDNAGTGLSPALAALIKENLKPNEILRYGEGETELVIEVSHTVPIGVKAEAVRRATDLLFQEDIKDISGYMTAFSDFALRYGVLTAHTNIEIPSDLHDAWAVILYTPIFDEVVGILGEKSVFDFVFAFKELVEARKQEIIYSINWNKLLDKILDKIGGLSGGLVESLKNIDLKGLDIEKILESVKEIQGTEGLNLENIAEMFAKNK